jgi:hypothetical protein
VNLFKYLVRPAQFLTNLAIVVPLVAVTDWSFWPTMLAVLMVAVTTEYLWCGEGGTTAWRSLTAGDPNPWQIWRWMDISGPSGHENGGHEELYLRRLYVFRCPKGGLMIHWIKREDWDRDALHDHPWEFWRFIVSGGYTEEVAYPSPYGMMVDTEDGCVEFHPATELLPSELRTHRWLRASKFPTGAYHRITSVKPHTVSLVINGPKSNSWGFFVPGTGKVPWRDYVNGAR